MLFNLFRYNLQFWNGTKNKRLRMIRELLALSVARLVSSLTFGTSFLHYS